MLCPNCKNELMVDHVTSTTDTEGATTTSYFYSCLTPQCQNYRKIINGSEEGAEAKIITPEIAAERKREKKQEEPALEPEEQKEKI